MNQLRAWLYGHNGYAEDRQRRGTSLNLAESRLENEEHLQERHEQLESTRRNRAENGSVLHSVLLRVIPLAPGDCLECKLVGTSVMMLSGVVVMMSAFTAKRGKPKLAGVNHTVYYMLCGSLFLGFEVTAFCRLFDMGPFEKHGQNSVTKATKQE